MSNYLQKKIKKINVYYPLIILFITGVFFLSTIPSVRTSWALATTVKPETFTELYFEDHLNLPNKITPNKVYSFKFDVHNLENKDMTYPYEIYLQAGNVKLPIKKAVITVKNNQYQTVKEDFLIDAPISRSEIVVNLINKNQQIDFWIENATSSAPSTTKNVTTNQAKETVNNKTTSPTPTIFLPIPTRPIPSPLEMVASSSATAASTSATTKQYGGWYWNTDTNKAMVWLGKDNNGQDIWSDKLPQ
jgi:hypothetical protein